MKRFAKQRQWLKDHKGILIAAGVGIGVGAYAGYKLFHKETGLPDIEVPCTVIDPEEVAVDLTDNATANATAMVENAATVLEAAPVDDDLIPSSLELTMRILRQDDEETVIEIEDLCADDLGQFGLDLVDAEILDECSVVQARLHLIY